MSLIRPLAVDTLAGVDMVDTRVDRAWKPSSYCQQQQPPRPMVTAQLEFEQQPEAITGRLALTGSDSV